MAETIAETVLEPLEDFDTQPDLHVVEPVDERPPKITPEEAEYLLARGPYYARLIAARRVLWLVQTYAGATTLIDPEYLDRLYDKADMLEVELNKYDIDNEPPEPEPIIPVVIERPQIVHMELEVPVETSEQRVLEARQEVDEAFNTDDPEIAVEPEAPMEVVSQTPEVPRRHPQATREIEGRDAVNLYLEEIARTPASSETPAPP